MFQNSGPPSALNRLLRLVIIMLAAAGAVAIALNSKAFGAVTPPPAASARPIGIGYEHTIASAALGEARVVNVVLPPGYAREPEKRYPTLYVIDGGLEQDLLHVTGVLHLGALWGRSSEAIVVGIETKDRRRELTARTFDPELLQRYPSAGASGSFRNFIRDEVKPLVARLYRTNGRDAVIGESLAGLFVLETYLEKPSLFGAYASIDPSLWWDRERLSSSAAAKLGAGQSGRPFYLAVAREQTETPAAMRRVAEAIGARGTPWCFALRPDLLHSTIYQQLTPQALQFLLPPATPPEAQFGFDVRCEPSSG